MKIIFNTITEIARAFKNNRIFYDQETADQIAIVEQRMTEGDELRFFEHDRLNIEEKVLSILAEQQQDISPERLKIIVEFLDNTRKNNEIRKRFWVQALITFIIFLLAGWYLQSGQSNPETEKVIFGFVGTVIGYWLR